jgi:chromosomal replication initiation ATPase DnaA
MLRVCEQVAVDTGVPVRELRGPSRKRGVIEAKQRAYAECYAAHEKISFPVVADFFGRDHSTIISGRRKHMERAALEQELAA